MNGEKITDSNNVLVKWKNLIPVSETSEFMTCSRNRLAYIKKFENFISSIFTVTIL